MSDLTGKFTGFEGIIGANHLEIMAALNSIVEGIGGVPTTPSATLADVVTALNNINSNISGMRAANSLYYSSALGLLEQINTNTDTMITNNSLNAQLTIRAIYETFCECDMTTPLLPPPINVTPTELSDDPKCRRIQFYIALFTDWLQRIANYSNTGATITGGVLDSLLAAAGAAAGMTATGAEVGAAGGIPGAIAGAIVGAIVGAVYAFGGSYLVDVATTFAGETVQAELLAGLYAADSADEGQAAFQEVIGEHFATIPAGILNFLWWSAWSNDMYSTTPVVDDSAFDGTICAPALECNWVTIRNNPNVTIDLSRAMGYFWGDEGDGLACDILLGLISGSPQCKLFRDGIVISDWSAIPQHLEFSGAGHYELRCDGTGSFSCVFQLCQPPL